MLLKKTFYEKNSRIRSPSFRRQKGKVEGKTPQVMLWGVSRSPGYLSFSLCLPQFNSIMNVIPYKRSAKRARSSGRSRVLPRRVPRVLRYNGENKITRTVVGTIAYTQAGFALGVTNFQAMSIVFDPTGVTFYGNATQSNNFALPNASEIAALYDLMRIDKVELTWSNNTSAVSNGGTGINRSAKYLVCNDSNDGVGTTALDQIQQQPNKSFYSTAGTEHKWTCVPKYSRVVYQTVAVSNYEPTRGFVNSNSTIPHYAIKMGISNLSSLATATNETLDFTLKFFLTLKHVK